MSFMSVTLAMPHFVRSYRRLLPTNLNAPLICSLPPRPFVSWQRLLAMGQYGMGPGSWPSGHYSAGTRPTRPVLDQLHHHYAHGHRHMQVRAHRIQSY